MLHRSNSGKKGVIGKDAYRLAGRTLQVLLYAGDGDEPEHIHVERDANVATLWLSPIRLERSGGFGRPELREILRIVQEQRVALLEAWDDYFEG
ncbi:MAG: hypothetical protein A2147_03490 [Chloroflexi bacterium RBG_16_57_8]|nr:MAG: hypothetical protein A2147_03490 [Chloroflexi bacterium RBG_16_57_8]